MKFATQILKDEAIAAQQEIVDAARPSATEAETEKLEEIKAAEVK